LNKSEEQPSRDKIGELVTGEMASYNKLNPILKMDRELL